MFGRLAFLPLLVAGACHGAAMPEMGSPPEPSSDAASGATEAGMPTTSLESGTPVADGSVLDAKAPPGANFDLSAWELQEPVGSPGNPTTIGRAQLEAGYEDAYFSTDPTNGAIVFFDPEDGVATANSSYPRTELRELAPDGSLASWAPAGTSTLSATVAVVAVPARVCVGQIHIADPLPDSGVAASTKPLLELFYDATGAISVGIEQSPSGGNEVLTQLATVPLGAKFNYVISLDATPSGGATIGVSIDGTTMTFPMPAGFESYGEYFKAGDYDQSASDASIGATVKFYALAVAHSP